MSGIRRARLALAGAVLLWCALLMAQGSAGPRDGIVPAFARPDALEPGPASALGRTFLEPGPRSGALVGVLLLLAPAALVGAALLARKAGPGRTQLLMLAGLLGLLSFLEPPRLSNDVFLYRATGEMLAGGGANPYRQSPADHFGAAALQGVPWSGQLSPYGPAALGLFAAGWQLTGSPTAQLWLLRAVLALPWAIAVFLAARRRPAGTALLLATSPLLLLEVVQSGHLDGWVGLLLALVCGLLARPTVSTPQRVLLVAALATAIALKLSAVVVGGAIFVHLVRHPAWGRGRALGAAAATAALVVLAFAPLWAGARTFDGLRAESTKVLQSLYQILQVPADAAGAIAAAGSGFALVLGMALAHRGWSPATASIAAIVLQAVIGRTFLQPWYFVPALMLAALARTWPAELDSRGERVVTDPVLWGVASVSLLAGGYAVVFAMRSVAPPVQTLNVLLMLLPPIAAGLLRARLRA